MSSHVDITYTYTGITAAGNEMVAELTEDAFMRRMIYWEDAMNHFLETGDMLTRNP